jgi:hypothetical protein
MPAMPQDPLSAVLEYLHSECADIAGIATIENSTSITGNTAPAGYGADVYNHGTLYVDITSIIEILNGKPALRS